MTPVRCCGTVPHRAQVIFSAEEEQESPPAASLCCGVTVVPNQCSGEGGHFSSSILEKKIDDDSHCLNRNYFKGVV